MSARAEGAAGREGEAVGPVIRRALLSVSDKTGIVRFARGLSALGVEIVSTGGTAALLGAEGIAVRTVEQVTGLPEMLDGRVRTLHPRIHAGILADRSKLHHMRAVERLGGAPIDLVAVNFYPFARVFAEGLSGDAATELIDIGGPCLVRAAAKNAAGAAPLASPARYEEVLDEMRRLGGRLSRETRARLAREAFLATAAYDAAIARHLGGGVGAAAEGAGGGGVAGAAGVGIAGAAGAGLPDPYPLLLAGAAPLRYGENPHQAAALFPLPEAEGSCAWRVLGGRALSYNNLADLDAATRIVQPLAGCAAAVVKHANPCGAALGATAEEAFLRAREADPVSAFGGIVALNRPVDATLAARLAETFLEAVAAPAFEPAALERLSAKRNLRVVEIAALARPDAPLPPALEVRATLFGYLVQEADAPEPAAGDASPSGGWRLVSGEAPRGALLEDARFAWHVVGYVKSNAIVLVRGGRTIGVGAGQMSRVEAVRLAVAKARAAGHDPAGSALASDGFFPFPDGVEEACAAGVRVIIQPGGSVKDDEVALAAERGEAAMLLTGRRRFRH